MQLSLQYLINTNASVRYFHAVFEVLPSFGGTIAETATVMSLGKQFESG
jgi:hypothetical protein